MSAMALPPEEVHVWQMALDRDDACLRNLALLLSEEEKHQAACFHFKQDRNRWIAVHGLLRVILGKYLATSPAALQFERGRHGKPKLIGEALFFNLSHSGNQALIAVAKQCEVGVDIERLRSDFSPEELAEHVFSAQEQVDLRSLPPKRRHHAFLTLWTGKEAYTKVRGEGLSYPLTQLTLRVDPDSLAFCLEDARKTDEYPAILLNRLPISENFVAALAVEGSLTAIRLLALGIL